MLSQLKSKLMEAGLDPTQITYVQELEASAIKRIQDILSPIVGSAQCACPRVAADVDFSQSEQTAETHRPNTTPPDISIRSQQTSESASTTPSALGVPGALSNQPPVPATAPLTQPAVPPAPAAGATTWANRSPDNWTRPASRRRSTALRSRSTRARIRRSTTRSTRRSAIPSRRSDRSSGLSAAVVLNHRKDAKGVAKPLADAELKQINDLVKEAMGFNQDRGDTVSVANAPFTVSEKTDSELALWKGPGHAGAGQGTLQIRGDRGNRRLPAVQGHHAADQDDDDATAQARRCHARR